MELQQPEKEEGKASRGSAIHSAQLRSDPPGDSPRLPKPYANECHIRTGRLAGRITEICALRIALIGPGRTRNGTGEYVARYLNDLGVRVTAVASSTPASADRAAMILERDYGIHAKPYPNATRMLAAEPADAVVICSPADTHLSYLRAVLEAGLHTFCEKPLLGDCEIASLAGLERLVEDYRAAGLVLHENTQWPYVLAYFPVLFQQGLPGEIEDFWMELYPPTSSPPAMAYEAVPHANSMLLAICGRGRMRALEITKRHDPTSQPRLGIEFDFVSERQTRTTRVTYRLGYRPTQPRPATFAINGLRLDRELENPGYRMYLRAQGRRVRIEDPLLTSLKDFTNAVMTPAGERLPSPSDAIRDNARMLWEIVNRVEQSMQ
jgi:hypothetical protein